MKRVFIRPPKAIPYRYTDSLHAALVAAFRSAGVHEEDVIGAAAKPWTFATKGYSKRGGQSFLTGLTVSTSDAGLGAKLVRLDPEAILWNSSNGDRIDFSGARVMSMTDPVQPGQKDMRIAFASPFVISKNSDEKKTWVNDLTDIDLSAAFTAGLSRRIGRQTTIRVKRTKLDILADSKRYRLVSLRQTKTRDVVLPAFAIELSLEGSEEDLRAAYFAGLGEKTRYGFGCPAVVK